MKIAFSTSVMGALARQPAPQGISAMNAINVVILNPLFLAVFMGTALVSLAIAAGVLLGWSGVASGWAIAGAVLYLVGNIGVTMAVNVPMNNALAAVAPDSEAGAAEWAAYLDRWVLWNHIRALACLGALACFIVALM